MTEQKHTPLPWILRDEEGNSSFPDDHTYSVWGGEDMVMDDDRYYNTAPSKENAAFIVRACNSHYELLSALKDMKAAYERHIRSTCTPEQIASNAWECGEYIAAERIIAKAEGGAA